MYGLDVNFLKDRGILPSQGVAKARKRPSEKGERTPLYIGLAAGVLIPALVGGAWLYLQNQNEQLGQEIAALDTQLGGLDAQLKDVAKLKEEITRVKAETQALATVFNQIRPTSAILQTVRVSTPQALQVDTIKQVVPTAAAQGQLDPTAPASIQISGVARSFNEVNDLLITLQRSPFFQPTSGKIVSAELIDAPIQSAGPIAIKPPQVVKYTVELPQSNAPASTLVREYERNGTLGLVTRIRTLQQKGVVQK